MAQALATCMSCNMRVPGVDGGGGGGGRISQFWPQQACAVHLFVFMSLKNFLIDEHAWLDKCILKSDVLLQKLVDRQSLLFFISHFYYYSAFPKSLALYFSTCLSFE